MKCAICKVNEAEQFYSNFDNLSNKLVDSGNCACISCLNKQYINDKISVSFRLRFIMKGLLFSVSVDTLIYIFLNGVINRLLLTALLLICFFVSLHIFINVIMRNKIIILESDETNNVDKRIQLHKEAINAQNEYLFQQKQKEIQREIEEAHNIEIQSQKLKLQELNKIQDQMKIDMYRLHELSKDRNQKVTREMSIVEEISLVESVEENSNNSNSRVFAEESILKKHGYMITGLTDSERWDALTKNVIPNVSLKEVVYTISGLINGRRKQNNGNQKYAHAIKKWTEDLNQIKLDYYYGEFKWPKY